MAKKLQILGSLGGNTSGGFVAQSEPPEDKTLLWVDTDDDNIDVGNSAISEHNSNTSAHPDIREQINQINQISSEKVDKIGITLDRHTDGLIYIFIDGQPKGNGVEFGTLVEGDVVGTVDENNNILLSGDIPDGTYTLKYENKDGTYTDVGTIEVGKIVTYIITQNLTAITSDNSTVEVREGESFTTNLTVNDGYTLSSVVVTMGGVNITSTAVSGTTIGIANVTGDVVITAIATKPNYTNLADSTSADWARDSRISSSGAVKNDEPGFVVTNYIPVTKAQTIHIKNAQLLTGYNHGHYNSSKTLVAGVGYAALVERGQIATADYDSGVTLYKNVGLYSADGTYAAWADNMVYARLTLKPTGAESDIIITVNENIV